MKARTRNIFFIFGVAAVVVMLFTFDVSFAVLWKDLTRAGYWLIAILGMWFVLYSLNALSWRIIIRGSGPCTVSFWRIFKVTVTGFALNYATPVGLMGGEPYKIMEMTPFIGGRRATSSVLLFAMMHIFSHFWFWLSGVVLYVLFMPVDVAMGILLSLILIFCFLGIYLFVKGYKNGMVVKVIRLLSHVPGLKKWSRRFAVAHAEDLEKIDRQISELQSQNKRSFYASFFLEYIGRFLQAFEIFFMLQIFTDNSADMHTYLQSVLVLAFTSLFANLLFFMPLQLGGREGGFAMSTANMGMSNDIGMFISIICRVRELFWTSAGLLFMKLGNKPVSGKLPSADVSLEGGRPAEKEYQLKNRQRKR